MAIAFVTGGTANGNAATSATVTISPSTTGGASHDMLVAVSLGTTSATVSSITATGGTALFKKVNSTTSGSTHVELWAAFGIAAGITSITVNFASSNYSIAAGEYSGVAQWGCHPTTGAAACSGTAVRTGSYIVYAGAVGGSTNTLSAGANTTIDQNGGNANQSSPNCDACLARNTSTTASDLSNFTVTVTNATYMMGMELNPTADSLGPWTVQRAQSAGTGTNPGLKAVLRGTVGGGHLLVFGIQGHSAAPSYTITDVDANTWSSAVGPQADSGSVFSGQIFYAANTKAGSATAWNWLASTSNPTTPCKFFISEYAGMDIFQPLDPTASASGSSTAPSSGATAATTQVSELVVGFVACETAAGSIAAGGSYTLRQSQGEAGVEDLVTSATGAQTATFTLGTTGSWACLVATFELGSFGWEQPNSQPVMEREGFVTY